MTEREGGPRGVEGRLSNVSGLVSCPSGAPAERVEGLGRLLLRLCDEVWVVGAAAVPPARPVEGPGGSPVDRLAAALAGISAERVLVVEAATSAPSPALLLALTAWPESDAVVAAPPGADPPDTGPPPADALGAPACAMLRRVPVLAAARACLEAGDESWAALLARVETSVLAADELAALAAVDFTARAAVDSAASAAVDSAAPAAPVTRGGTDPTSP